jgi:hypothetical protein
MITRQERLMVEGVDLTWPSVHKDKDNPLCLWLEVRCFRRERIDVLRRRSDGIRVKQPLESQKAKAASGLMEKLTARCHCFKTIT